MTTIDWDAAADTFDQEPDHGLVDPGVRRAWADRLTQWLPQEPSDVLDLGCGTGSLALLAAEAGHRVTGVDLSPQMAARARAKLAGTHAEILEGPADRPPVGERRFDVVLARHVVWLLPDPEAAVRHWASLLRTGGRLVLVRGGVGRDGAAGRAAHRRTRAPHRPGRSRAALGGAGPVGAGRGRRAVRPGGAAVRTRGDRIVR